MRIISGYLKGRRLSPPANLKARPTTDIAKEGLFNILNNEVDFEQVTVLDMFGGTGSISLEFISRGCTDVTLIEMNQINYNFIRKTRDEFNLKDAWEIIKGDSFKFIEKCGRKYDIIFADPPYALEDLATIPDKVFAKDILHPQAYLILEHPDDYDFSGHDKFIKEKKYGNVHFSFFENK